MEPTFCSQWVSTDMYKPGIMQIWKFVLILAATLSCVFQVVRSENPSPPSCSGSGDKLNCEKKLLYVLLQKNGYEKSLRPVNDVSKKVEVKFGIAFVKITELDERTHVLRAHTWVRQLWRDDSLKWEPADYGGITTMRMPSDRVWTPDIVLYNSVSAEYKYAHPISVVVYNTGDVLYIPQLMLESTCPLDLRHYPMDTQICMLKFGSWAYSGDEVALDLYEGTGVDFSDYMEHQEWAVTNHTVKFNNKKYPCCSETYPDITYSLTLTRQSNTHHHLLVAPAILLILLIPAIFALPPDTGDKITLGIGLVIAQVLMFLMLIEFLPGGNFTVPIIGQAYVFGLAMSVIALALAVLVRNVWNHSYRQHRLPVFVRTVLLGIFGRLCCTSREVFMPPDNAGSERMRQYSEASGGVGETGQVGHDDKTQIVRYVELTAPTEWRQLAVILDRIFFCVFGVVIAIGAIIVGTI